MPARRSGRAFRATQVLPIFVAVVIVAGLLFAYTFEVLTVVVIAYLALIPVSVVRYRKLERAHALPAPVAEAASDSQA